MRRRAANIVFLAIYQPRLPYNLWEALTKTYVHAWRLRWCGCRRDASPSRYVEALRCSLTGLAVATVLKVCCMQVGGYRPQFRPHRGVIWQGFEPKRLTSTSAALPDRPHSARRAPLIRRGKLQITLRCALIERIGQLTTGCRGSGCSVEVSNGDAAVQKNRRHRNTPDY